MKRYFTLGLSVIILFFLCSVTFASWTTLNFDFKYSYDESHSTRNEDTGPTSSQGYNFNFEIPFLPQVPLKSTMGVTSTSSIASATQSFRISLNASHPYYSFQASRSEDNHEDASGGGGIAIRNDFSASFTPHEKYLPQLRYSFSESDTDLGGASNGFDFKINEDFKPGNKVQFGIAYSITKTMNILTESETQDQRANFRLNMTPFNNVKLSINKDYGLSDNTGSSDPSVENTRTSYDLNFSPFKEVTGNPIQDLAFDWKRDENFNSSNGQLTATTTKTFSFTLKPINKVDIRYDYSLSENEGDDTVTSTDNNGQSLTVTIPLMIDIDLKYTYNLKKNVDTYGYGTNSEDNGFSVGYHSPMLKGSALILNFAMDTNSKQVITDMDVKEQNAFNWGFDGHAAILKVWDITFSHKDSLTKSSNYIDDQESVQDSIGTSYKYDIVQLINGGIDLKYNTRNSNARTLTSENSDRSISNHLDYKTGNLALGLTLSYSESEADEVSSKKTISPNLSYGLSSGRISLRYSITDRVDEDYITGALNSSRDVNYDFGFTYNIAAQATLDLRYSIRNHIDFTIPDNNEDGDKFSTGISFKF